MIHALASTSLSLDVAVIMGSVAGIILGLATPLFALMNKQNATYEKIAEGQLELVKGHKRLEQRVESNTRAVKEGNKYRKEYNGTIVRTVLKTSDELQQSINNISKMNIQEQKVEHQIVRESEVQNGSN